MLSSKVSLLENTTIHDSSYLSASTTTIQLISADTSPEVVIKENQKNTMAAGKESFMVLLWLLHRNTVHVP